MYWNPCKVWLPTVDATRPPDTGFEGKGFPHFKANAIRRFISAVFTVAHTTTVLNITLDYKQLFFWKKKKSIFYILLHLHNAQILRKVHKI